MIWICAVAITLGLVGTAVALRDRSSDRALTYPEGSHERLALKGVAT